MFLMKINRKCLLGILFRHHLIFQNHSCSEGMNMNTSIFLGAAYYPELWTEKTMEQDIRLMRQIGINLVRIGEFSWAKMEPDMDEFDFTWLHRIIDTLSNNGIHVLLGTPTAAPPVWLTARYPEILHLDENDQRSQHGERCQCCVNTIHFKERSALVVEKMAMEFSGDPAIIGWQLDNELVIQGMGCFCEACRQAFALWLEEKYGTIDHFNQSLQMGLWSMTYQRFDQVQPPKNHTWSHPTVITEWLSFQGASNSKFLQMQASILKHHGVTAPIGTDMMTNNVQDYADTTKELDVIQFNHYTPEKLLRMLPFWFSYIRTLKQVPFWVTETAPTWPGATVPQGYREKGYCRANTWLAYASGARINLYWLWRSHLAGQELMHGSILSSDGRPTHAFNEIAAISEELRIATPILSSTKVQRSKIGIHLSNFSELLFKGQQLIPDLVGSEAYIKLVSQRLFTPLLECQYLPDMIDTSLAVDEYKVIITALIPNLEKENLITRMIEWVKRGGIWVVGPLTDIRDVNCVKYQHAPYGFMEELAGVHCQYQIPSHPKPFRAVFNNGQEFECELWCDGFQLANDTQSLAQYKDYPLEGLSAVAYKKIGEGGIMLLGTLPDEKAYVSLIRSICDKAKIEQVANATGNLAVLTRIEEKSSSPKEYKICIEYKNKPAIYKNTKIVENILTGKVYKGNIKIKPYGVMILQETENGEINENRC